MAHAELTPRMKPGQTITAYAAAADILPGRFVSPTAAYNADGNLPCAHTAAGKFAVGASQGKATFARKAQEQERTCPVNTGGILRVEAGAAIAAITGGNPTPVASDATGRAVAATAGAEILGVIVGTAAAQAGDIVHVQYHPRGLAV